MAKQEQDLLCKLRPPRRLAWQTVMSVCFFVKWTLILVGVALGRKRYLQIHLEGGWSEPPPRPLPQRGIQHGARICGRPTEQDRESEQCLVFKDFVPVNATGYPDHSLNPYIDYNIDLDMDNNTNNDHPCCLSFLTIFPGNPCCAMHLD